MAVTFTFEKESDILMVEKIKIGFIGAGKVGCSLGMLLKENQFLLSGYYSHSYESASYAASLTNSAAFSNLKDLILETDWLFLTVNDQQLVSVWEEVLELLQQGLSTLQCVFHCSGMHDSKLFHDAVYYHIETGSIHPLCAVHSKEQGVKNLRSCVFSIEGSNKAVEQASSICEAMHLKVVVLRPDGKVRYHVAAVMGSNLVLGLLKLSNDLFIDSGFSKEQAFDAMMSLVKGNLSNLEQTGFLGALTGPVERNDAQTVKIHLEHLSEDESKVYCLLSKKILEIAREKHPDLDFGLIKEMLNHEEHSNINVTAERTE